MEFYLFVTSCQPAHSSSAFIKSIFWYVTVDVKDLAGTGIHWQPQINVVNIAKLRSTQLNVNSYLNVIIYVKENILAYIPKLEKCISYLFSTCTNMLASDNICHSSKWARVHKYICLLSSSKVHFGPWRVGKILLLSHWTSQRTQKAARSLQRFFQTDVLL